MKNQKRKSSIFSIAAVAICSGVIALTACKKEDIVNPSPAVKSETVSPALVDKSKQEALLSLLPIGEKTLEEYSENLRNSLNNVYAQGAKTLYDVQVDTFYVNVPLTNGKINLINQQTALIDAAAQVTNLLNVLNGETRVVIIDLVSVADNGTGGVLGLRALTEKELLEQLTFCNFENDLPNLQAFTKLKDAYNECSAYKFLRGNDTRLVETVYSRDLSINNDVFKDKILYSSTHSPGYSAGSGMISEDGIWSLYYAMRNLQDERVYHGMFGLPKLVGAERSTHSYAGIITATSGSERQHIVISFYKIPNSYIRN